MIVFFAEPLLQLIAATEAALEKYSYKKVFWKYAANLHENVYAWAFSCKFTAYFQKSVS